MRPLIAPVLAGSLTFTACAVGPDYVPPAPPTPDAWHQRLAEGLDAGRAPLQTWWRLFEDPLLVELVGEAQASNRDLQAAYFRIREARAIRGIAAADRLPQVSADGEIGRLRPSESTTGLDEATTPAAAALGASWEIDLFGRVRRSVEAATADYQANVEDYRDLLVALLADVAVNYIDVRTLQLRLEYAQNNIRAQRDSLQLTRDRFDAGLTSGLDVAQAESNLASSESEVPRLVASREAALNRLAVLVGRAPGALHERLSGRAAIPSAPESVATGLPADLLRQRPDVRAAERRLAAQTARIGIATADLYPRLSLTGFFGSDALDVDDFGSGDSATWGIGLPIRWSLFQGGRIRRRIEAEEARTDAAHRRYEQIVLLAIEDVESSLAAWSNERERLDRLREAVDASQRAVEMVRTQYVSGLTNFQNVLDTERSLFRIQDQLAESEGGQVRALVGVYRALGGGWDSGASDVEAPAGLAPAESPD